MGQRPDFRRESDFRSGSVSATWLNRLPQTCPLQQQCVMVCLTITPAILRALQDLRDRGQVLETLDGTSEPSLDKPTQGKPITHGQIIAISKTLKTIHQDAPNRGSHDQVSYHLDDLLRGSKVYVEPPKPKAEPVSCTYFLLHYAVLLIPDRPLSTKP